MMHLKTFEKEDIFPFDPIFFQDQIDRLIEGTIPFFFRLIRKQVFFHLFFVFLGGVEIVLLLFFAADLLKSSLLAAACAALFLTFFSYFTLRLYMQAKRPALFETIESHFIQKCSDLIDFRGDLPEHRFALAEACTKFAIALQGTQEKVWGVPSQRLDVLKSTLESFSFWWHWHDVHVMRERLLLAAVKEHLVLVKMEPIDLQVHAALANAYVTLSSIYLNPHAEGGDEERTIPHEMYRKELEKQFRLTAKRAIEEFKIINDVAPDDPWVHLQLAYSYHDLGMPEEEIQEYEALMALLSDDEEILFKLGQLYFQQGHNAKGLKIYETLKNIHPLKADQLIQDYGGIF